jgi:hypothetical protein
MLLVYRYRIKSLIGLLNGQARACNFVWNFCNETQQHALKWNKRWPTGFDLGYVLSVASRMTVISTPLAISSSVRDIERLLRESPSFLRTERMSNRRIMDRWQPMNIW